MARRCSSNCPFLLWPPCFVQCRGPPRFLSGLQGDVPSSRTSSKFYACSTGIGSQSWCIRCRCCRSLILTCPSCHRGADSNTEHRRHRTERRNPQQLSRATSVQPLTQVRARHTAAATHSACTLLCLDWLFLPYFALLCFAMLCVALLCSSCLTFLLCCCLICLGLLYLALFCFVLSRFALLCVALVCFALICFSVLWRRDGAKSLQITWSRGRLEPTFSGTRRGTRIGPVTA